jgi:cholesterol transport system auxiliary component
MRTPARLILVAGCALALSGCVSLLPKGKPAHLYRFGQTMSAGQAPAAAAPAVAKVGVLRANASFQQESAGDRILTITGEKAAYVGETRWVSPAAVLWDQAVTRAFEDNNAPVQLVARGEASRADYALRIDVRNFETRYDDGPETTPAVLIRIRAVLTNNQDRDHPAERIFEIRAPAASNRVTSIVPAYDKAVADILNQLTSWANAQVAPTPVRRAASPR